MNSVERRSSYWACRRGFSVASRRQLGGRLDTGQISPPGVAGSFLVLALQPEEVILKGWLPWQSAAIALVAVEGQDILKQDRARPAVAQQVVLGEQEAMVVRNEAKEIDADQRRLVQQEAGAAVFELDGDGAPFAFARFEGAQIVLPPGHGAARMNDLDGVSEAVLLEADTQVGVAIEQSVEGAAQAGEVEGALEFQDELDEIGILALIIIVSMEEQAFL